ncbi:Bro-N domain-containing protein [Pseudomonas cichorii]|nr:Bro-N domain-containing protein [Pseudomonas cichorii]MBX8582836.1 Bro-N domain-containing protein [Pseudomonas cichorii]MBX8600551.1 Bro-N domain-containing protein [Pseudomonas cichorii]
MLRAIFTESQAWFCLSDLARLMGQTLGERSSLKLDADQRRVVWLQANGKWQKQLMVSESGAFALLVHHYVPENRALRQWLTHEVLPVLHGAQNVTLDNPRLSYLQWPGTSLSVMQWRDGRKDWLLSDSSRSAAASAQLYSLIEIVKTNIHPPMSVSATYWIDFQKSHGKEAMLPCSYSTGRPR